MHHIMRLRTGTNPDQSFRLQCTCGTGGDFADEAQAEAYKDRHFARLGGIDDGEYLIGDAPSTYMQAPPVIPTPVVVHPNFGAAAPARVPKPDKEPVPTPVPKPVPAPVPEPERKKNGDGEPEPEFPKTGECG